MREIIVTTSHNIALQQIDKITGVITNTVSTEINHSTTNINEIIDMQNQSALDGLKIKAEECGADAIVSLNIQLNKIELQSKIFLQTIATGTAVILRVGWKKKEEKNESNDDFDPLFKDAARLIVQSQVGSSSLIQRRMKLGQLRASKIMEQLKKIGIIKNTDSTKISEVLIKSEYELEIFLEKLFKK